MTINHITFKGHESGAIKQVSQKVRELAGNEVLVAVHHAGFCGTDMHYLKADMVLGHEGAGVVQEIGSGVTSVKM